MAQAQARSGPEPLSPAEAIQAEAHQFVTFYLGVECFAFPMERVLEIIRVPSVVAVPLTPPGFAGLANLRGAILPILDLRRTLALPDRPVDDASRTMVVDCGHPIGLIVDRVSRVISFADDRIEASEAGSTLGGATGQSILAGVIKDSEGAGLIQILDASNAIALASLTTQSAQKSVDGPTRQTVAAEAEATTGLQLVNLLIGNQEYAFDISEDDEIVRPPETIFQLPQAASHVLGIIDLRNRLLPIVSLRRMFGLPDMPVVETNRILVVRVPGTTEARIGIVVDQVREVLNVQAADLVKISGMINRDGAQRIGAMCRLDEGKRLVGVLSGATLFTDTAIANAITKATQGTETAEKIVLDTSSDPAETQLVVYQLAGQEYGIDIASVREIIRVPADLKHVPHSPDYVAGVINVRGAVLPVVTLRIRFGVGEVARTDRERIIVLNRDGVQTGYIVDAVAEVLRIPRSRLEPAPALSPEQSRLIGTVANLNDGKRIIQIVDAAALFADGMTDVTSALQPA